MCLSPILRLYRALWPPRRQRSIQRMLSWSSGALALWRVLNVSNALINIPVTQSQTWAGQRALMERRGLQKRQGWLPERALLLPAGHQLSCPNTPPPAGPGHLVSGVQRRQLGLTHGAEGSRWHSSSRAQRG